MRRLCWPACSLCFLAVAFTLTAQQTNVAGSSVRTRFRISGTVVNALTGEPVADARVALGTITGGNEMSGNEVQTTFSDDNGRFRFDSVAPAKYSLTAEARGYPSQAFDQHEGGYSTAIAVGPNLISEDLRFRLQMGAVIAGEVIDEFNEPVREGQVLLFEDTLRDGRRSVQQRAAVGLNDLGAYRFSNLPAGKYFVAVSAEPWYAQHPGPGAAKLNSAAAESEGSLDVVFPLTFYSGALDSAAATPIVVRPGDRAAADLTLRALPAAHLRIKAPAGERAQYPRIVQPIFDGVEFPAREQRFESEGASEVAGLAPGHYLVHTQPSGNGSGGSQEIEVAGDTEIQSQTSPLSAAISGMVTWEGGKAPTPPVFIYFSGSKSGQNMTSEIAPDGQFEIHAYMPPGRYDVALANAGDFLVKSIAAKGAGVVGRAVEIKGDAPVRLSVTASRQTSRLDGTALEHDHPVGGALILLAPQQSGSGISLYRRDQSDSDGTFTLPNVLPGNYTVIAIKDGWNLEWANPAVLGPYLAHGQQLRVQANGRYKIKVEVQ